MGENTLIRQPQKYLVLNYDQYSEANSAYLNIDVKEAP